MVVISHQLSKREYKDIFLSGRSKTGVHEISSFYGNMSVGIVIFLFRWPRNWSIMGVASLSLFGVTAHSGLPDRLSLTIFHRLFCDVP